LALAVSSRADAPGLFGQVDTSEVTPVEGPSWISHLGLPFGETAMGRVGRWGSVPAESVDANPPESGSMSSRPDRDRPLRVSGADLYRLNCQSCHRADGAGAPPEINSVIGPVRATSVELTMERMKEMGRPIPRAFAEKLASGAEASLRQRLAKGGEKMPPFSHLDDLEVKSLLSHLERLAGTPHAPGDEPRLVEPLLRVGEHLVKGTCHICHDAAGPTPSPEAIWKGAIPPLAGLPDHMSVEAFVAKVRHGKPAMMRGFARVYVGRMPVFSYLREDEVFAAYLYLLELGPDTEEAASHAAPERGESKPRPHRAPR
jgi:mono/diheme cytochrome c family protein